MEIRALLASDQRAHFSCGDLDLDRFIRRFAGQNQFRHHIGTTYVAVEDERIWAFATVTAGQIEMEGLPPAVRKSLPEYPLPILRLARLGVDLEAQGQGLGLALLRFVFGLARRMAQDYGCVGVMVDAKSDAVSYYARLGFMVLEVLAGESGTRPAPTPMFLPLSEIEAAVEGP